MLAAVMVAAAAAASAAAAPASERPDVVEHRVRDGDTLEALARRYRVAGGWQAIARLNGVSNEYRLRPGSTLRIPVRPSLPSSMARIDSWRGDVAVITRGARRNITAPTVVREGDVVATAAASFATVTLPDGSQSSLPSNSRIRIERLRGTPGRTGLDVRFVLDGGGLDTKAAPQRPGSRFEVRTPVAVAAVRGTEFRVAVDSAAPSRTEVIEGAVAFSAGQSEVRVPAGFGTIAENGGVRPPVALLPSPVFAASPSTEALRVRVEPVAGARGYRFDVATDAGFLDRLAERASDSPEARFEVGGGDLFVRARAVDALGLVGLGSVRAVKAPGPATEGAARCPVRVACLLFRFAPQPAGSAGTRLLIFRDAEGRQVAVDRAGLPGDRATIVALAPGHYWFATEAGTPAVRTALERFTLMPPESPPAP